MASEQNHTVTPYLVPALERGLRILELLSRCPGGLTMAEMASLRLPAASLYRLLVTLTELGYVVREETDRYRLSRKLLSLGYRGIDDSSLVETALEPMRRLRDRSGETVMLGVLHGAEGIVIESVHSNQAVCVSVRIGHHYPLHTAAPGKAMLAFLPDREKKELLRKLHYTKFTQTTIGSEEEFEHELAEVRRIGIAYDRGEELPELRCVGAPVLDVSGYPVAAVWLGGPESRLDDQTLELFGAMVRETAAQIQERLC